MTGSITKRKGLHESLEVEWEIPLSQLTHENTEASYESPAFDLLGKPFHLRMDVPGGSGKVCHLQFYLLNKSHNCQIFASGSFKLEMEDDSFQFSISRHHIINKRNEYKLELKFNEPQPVLKISDMDPGSNLILIGEMSPYTGHSIKNLFQLCEDLNDIMVKQYNSDFKIRVNGQVLNLHQNIITARAPFFALMISDKMKEASTNIVDIEDFDEHIFMLFFEYLYTGEAIGVNDNSLFDLYELSNKYQVLALKRDCLTSMRISLSTDTFFKVFSLAEKYGEKEIKTPLSEFCSNNLKELMKNRDWITLMKNSAENVYDLLATSLENYERKVKTPPVYTSYPYAYPVFPDG